MNAIDSLIKNPNDKIIRFDRYTIIKPLGNGEQGHVFKISDSIGIEFGLKLYPHSNVIYTNSVTGKEIDIPSEIGILASLNHKNIVSIISAGIAIWDEIKEIWKLDYSFPKKIEDETDKYYFYIMEFVNGVDLNELFTTSKTQDGIEESQLLEKASMFEKLISQISEAIIYYQSQGITHKDIKAENILYSKDDSNFLLVDFGFARHITSPQEKEYIKKTDIMDFVALQAKDYVLYDIGQFALLLLDKILPKFESVYDTNRYNGIKSVLLKASGDKKERYRDMKKFYSAISSHFMIRSGWNFSLKINEYLTPNYFGRFNSKIRIPVSGSIMLSKEVRKIIDTPEFQRLRGIRQLGTARYVFPGATHTRFEHSLGTYHLSLRYLNSLLDWPRFKEAIVPIDESIKLITLSALLHDIGHYPYSHWIEEINSFKRDIDLPEHEKRAESIINNSKIRKIIEEDWNVSADLIGKIIACNDLSGVQVLINSFINSIIDVDKLDYLIRDSIHCGVNYGKGIDIDRIIDSLVIDSTGTTIALTDKGRSCLLSILNCRNIMYQEVYWHKTKKACDSMFKRFMYDFIEESPESNDVIKEYLSKSDDVLANILYHKSIDKDYNNLIAPFAYKGREIYKPAFIIFRSNLREHPEMLNTIKFFNSFNKKSYKDNIETNNRLISELSDKLNKRIKPTEILIEKTSIKTGSEISEIDGIKIYNLREQEYEGYSGVLKSMNNYLENNRRVYIFCAPKYYKTLKKFKKDDFDRIFGKII